MNTGFGASAMTIAVVELRRRARTLTDNIWQLIALVIFGIFLVPFIGAMLVAFYAFGAGLETGAIDNAVEVVTLACVYTWIGVTLFSGYRAYTIGLQPDRLHGMLTTVSHRELLTGFVLAEFLLWGTIGLLVLLPGAAAFALGAGAPVAIFTILLTATLLLVTGLVTGFLVSLVISNMGARSVLLTRIRLALLALLGVAYVGVFITQAFDTILDPLYTIVAPTPIGWAGDLALLGVAESASLLRATGAVSVSLIGVGIGWIVLLHLSAALWYADGVHIQNGGGGTPQVFGYLERIVSRPTAGVVITDLQRARRAPLAISFALYPLIILIGPVMTAAQTGHIGTGLPLWVLLCGIWITGVLFTLNILGHEGSVLPVALLTNQPQRTLVRGHLTTAVLLGLPLTLVATVGVSIASPHSWAATATLGVSAVTLSIGAALLATGLGAHFPRFEEVTVTRSTKAVVPSMFAFATFSLVVVLVSLPTVLGHSGLADWIAVRYDTSVQVIRIIGTVTSSGLALTLGLFSTWYATRRITGFHLDR